MVHAPKVVKPVRALQTHRALVGFEGSSQLQQRLALLRRALDEPRGKTVVALARHAQAESPAAKTGTGKRSKQNGRAADSVAFRRVLTA
jgi:hypothetical protein